MSGKCGSSRVSGGSARIYNFNYISHDASVNIVVSSRQFASKECKLCRKYFFFLLEIDDYWEKLCSTHWRKRKVGRIIYLHSKLEICSGRDERWEMFPFISFSAALAGKLSSHLFFSADSEDKWSTSITQTNTEHRTEKLWLRVVGILTGKEKDDPRQGWIRIALITLLVYESLRNAAQWLVDLRQQIIVRQRELPLTS